MNYYCARITAVLFVDDGILPADGYQLDVQVHLFQAIDIEKAFEKALKIGRALETKYQNQEDKWVYWKFKSIESIKELGKSLGDLTEISSRLESYISDEILDRDTDFEPEKIDWADVMEA